MSMALYNVYRIEVTRTDTAGLVTSHVAASTVDSACTKYVADYPTDVIVNVDAVSTVLV